MTLRVLLLLLAGLPVVSLAARPEPALATAATESTLVGRVFLTPLERETLDRLRERQAVPLTVAPSSPAVVETPAKKPTGAGYIKRASGTAYEWSDGEFRRTAQNEVELGRFPGAIRIIVHPGKVTSANPAGVEASPELTNASSSAADSADAPDDDAQ